MNNAEWVIANLWGCTAVVLLALIFTGRWLYDKITHSDVRAIRLLAEQIKTESDLTTFLIHQKNNSN